MPVIKQHRNNLFWDRPRSNDKWKIHHNDVILNAWLTSNRDNRDGSNGIECMHTGGGSSGSHPNLT